MSKVSMLSARVPADLHRALKLLAAETGKPVQELVEDAIRKLLRRYGKEV